MKSLVPVVLTLIYWVVALGVILLAGYALPGDCWTERARIGFDQCINEGRIIYIAGLGIALLLYLVIWRFALRR
jgi:hypothetical protein